MGEPPRQKSYDTVMFCHIWFICSLSWEKWAGFFVVGRVKAEMDWTVTTDIQRVDGRISRKRKNTSPFRLSQ
jgi:hypothetical protein